MLLKFNTMKKLFFIISFLIICKTISGQCGDPKFSDLTGRFRANPPRTVAIYPNPTNTGSATIRSDFLLISTLEIYNSADKKVLEIPVFKMKDNIDLSSLPNGVYMVKFTSYGYTIKKTIMINQSSVKSFTVYPNPTNGITTIESETTLGTVSVYNQLGQLVNQQTTNENNLKIDLSSQPTGVYTIKANNDAVTVIKQ